MTKKTIQFMSACNAILNYPRRVVGSIMGVVESLEVRLSALWVH